MYINLFLIARADLDLKNKKERHHQLVERHLIGRPIECRYVDLSLSSFQRRKKPSFRNTIIKLETQLLRWKVYDELGNTIIKLEILGNHFESHGRDFLFFSRMNLETRLLSWKHSCLVGDLEVQTCHYRDCEINFNSFEIPKAIETIDVMECL